MSQVDRNYASFKEKLPSLLTTQRGRYALMKDGEIIAFYDTLSDAYVTAHRFVGPDEFSIQRVTDQRIDLGFFSNAVAGA